MIKLDSMRNLKYLDKKTKPQLQREFNKAKFDFLDMYHEINEVAKFDVLCSYHRPIGSKIAKKKPVSLGMLKLREQCISKPCLLAQGLI